jgi:hypothetical protein
MNGVVKGEAGLPNFIGTRRKKGVDLIGVSGSIFYIPEAS